MTIFHMMSPRVLLGVTVACLLILTGQFAAAQDRLV